MLNLAEDHNFDDMYKDAKLDSERFVYNILCCELNDLSDEARKVLDAANNLLEKSIKERMLLHESFPEYHLNTWDAGYAQLKLVWKIYYKEEFKEFRILYKELEDMLRPQVYELGFLLR